MLATPVEGVADEFELKVELRAYPNEVETDDEQIAIEVKELLLDLDLAGFSVSPKSKLGEHIKAPKVMSTMEREQTISKTTEGSMSGALSGKLHTEGAGEAGMELGVSGASKFSKQESTKRTETLQEEFFRVRAIGNDAWKVIDENGSALDGVYLNYDTLCRLKSGSKQNIYSIELAASAKQKNVKFKLLTSNILKQATTNQERLASIVIGKAIHEGSSVEQFSGHIVFSKSTAVDEE